MPSGLSGKWHGDSRMELYDLLAQVVQTFERLRIPYLVTGSVASI